MSCEANRISLNFAHSRFGRRWGDYHLEVLVWYDRRSHDDLDRMEQEFVAKPFLAGDRATIADVACCGYLFFIDEGKDDEASGVAWADAAGIDLTRWPARAGMEGNAWWNCRTSIRHSGCSQVAKRLLSHLPVAARLQVYDRGAGTAGGAGFDPPRQPVISQPGQGE